MKRKIYALLLMGVMTLSGIGGASLTAHAGNTVDHTFSFDNSNSSGNSGWRDKNDTTKVYVYPTAGPKIYYTVYGRSNKSSSGVNRSSKVAIPQGVQGSITNYVKESKDIQARLKFNRITTAKVTTSGVWSPDSTRNYTIYN